MQHFARDSSAFRDSEWSRDGPVTMAGLSKELVANAMYGDDMMRFRRVILNLLTQTGNVVVYRTRERKVVVAPYLVKQLVARDSLATMLNKVLEHSEFAR